MNVSDRYDYDDSGIKNHYDVREYSSDELVNHTPHRMVGASSITMRSGFNPHRLSESNQDYHYDALWQHATQTDSLVSPRIMTDESQATAISYTYYPYGESSATVTDADASANRYRFTGREYETAYMTFYRSRFYNNRMGRFFSKDRWQGDLKKPISLNKYLYVEGNPVYFKDPSGNCGVTNSYTINIESSSPISYLSKANQNTQLIISSNGNVGGTSSEELIADAAYCQTKGCSGTCNAPYMCEDGEMGILSGCEVENGHLNDCLYRCGGHGFQWHGSLWCSGNYGHPDDDDDDKPMSCPQICPQNNPDSFLQPDFYRQFVCVQLNYERCCPNESGIVKTCKWRCAYYAGTPEELHWFMDTYARCP